MFTPPVEVEAVIAAFASLFTRPSWQRAGTLLCGWLLAPANCVITSALRVLGLSDDKHFQNYHRVLNRARWSAHHAAGILLRLLVKAFVPAGPVVIGLDDTVEHRRGAKIAGRSMYRDAVRSSWGCFQKTSGLRWIGLHLIAPVRWAKRTWALPFLTALAPSGNNPPYVRAGRRHKPLSERARTLISQAQRWLPGRELIVVADGGYAVLDLLAWCQRLAKPVTMISRLRMDGALLHASAATSARTEGPPPSQRRAAAYAQGVSCVPPNKVEPCLGRQPGSTARWWPPMGGWRRAAKRWRRSPLLTNTGTCPIHLPKSSRPKVPLPARRLPAGARSRPVARFSESTAGDLRRVPDLPLGRRALLHLLTVHGDCLLALERLLAQWRGADHGPADQGQRRCASHAARQCRAFRN